MSTYNVLVPDTPVLDGVMLNGARNVPMMGRKGVAFHADVLNVIESDELFAFFECYFGEPATTFNYKWLRGVGNEQYTGAHMDYVYMGRGSANLHTVWIPLGDTPVDQGTLTMCHASNRLDSFERIRNTYGRMDVDRDGVDGWFTKNPLDISEKYGGEWRTTDFQMGDVMIFGMHTMHASTTNLTNRYRLSCDVRYQPASDPIDHRWIKNGEGHTWTENIKPIEEARQAWGV
ncbi:MAG: phytanoyl-CoA dioxygenase family protein [Chloroflexota bacterium]